jgi:pilus assembly protein CpaF
MKLVERLGDQRKRRPDGAQGNFAEELTGQLKTRLHTAVLDKLDLRAMADVDTRRMRDQLRLSVRNIIDNDAEVSMLNNETRDALVEALLDEIVGLGPLEPLLNDPAISDILINGADTIYVERGGRLEKSAIRFSDNTHLYNIISRIVSRVGRRVDESSPMVDARLADGSRVNAVVPPIAVDGPSMSIRRFGRRIMNGQDLVDRGVCTADMMKFLWACVHSKCNLLVSGGTGAGKTTLLNILSSFIPKEERVITIEDSAELNLQGAHVLRMEARPANLEGKGEVSIRSCVRNALRMRPDRVVIGEIRGGEVLDMLQAMNTGHEGSMATVHANTPRDAVDRLRMMLALSGVTISSESMSQFISRSVRVVVQVARALDGARRITHIAEVSEEENGEKVEVDTIFFFDPIKKRFIYNFNSKMQQRFDEHSAGIDVRSLT